MGCIWDVKFTAEGDLVTGCSDAVARVWTSREEAKVTGWIASDVATSFACEKVWHCFG